MEEQATNDAAGPGAPAADIVARGASYYRNTRYIMAIACIAMGAWFGYDGWVNWPQQNQKYDELVVQLRVAEQAHNDEQVRHVSEDLKNYKKHTSLDLALQKVLCVLLPPVGIGMLVWALYNSRGEYRLSNNTLTAPGHPPVSLDDITRIDKRLWDRKGIAYLDYDIAGKRGIVKLDDFLYERDPIDAIFGEIEQYVRSAPPPTIPPPTRSRPGA
jgi:hypothetical protein